jgi:glyoxylase-like metal-dependent hydrolase (beta-lactamase superfamily II)
VPSVVEFEQGLWQWTQRHPDWSAGEDWDPLVASTVSAGGGATVVVDPLLPEASADRSWLLGRLAEQVHSGGDVAVIVTRPDHERSAGEVAGRFAAAIWAPPEAELEPPGERHALATAPLPAGVLAIEDGRGRHECVLYMPEHQAVVAGDVLVRDESGSLRVRPSDDHETVVLPRLRRLLEHPIRHVLIAHGPPRPSGGAEELRAALDREPWAPPDLRE